MKTFEMLLREGSALLGAAEIEEARLDAWLLLEYVTGRNRAWYFAHADEEAGADEEQRYLELIRQRARHVPLQHLTHSACFMGYDFYVDGRVLVPRQDTEVLVEEALALLKEVRGPQVLDMCTGSGCILLSILKERSDAFGVGADISRDALAVAKRNAELLNVEKQAVLVESDTFSGEFFRENGGKQPQKYDMLISNPPYIPAADIRGLMDEVRLFDPALALDGGSDGLTFYRRITAQAPEYLTPNGWLLYEIGCDQGAAVKALMEQAGFCRVQVIKDLAGLDRVVKGQLGRPAAQEFQEEEHV